MFRYSTIFYLQCATSVKGHLALGSLRIRKLVVLTASRRRSLSKSTFQRVTVQFEIGKLAAVTCWFGGDVATGRNYGLPYRFVGDNSFSSTTFILQIHLALPQASRSIRYFRR